MQIWVDADACPAAAKEILFRAAERVRVSLTLVANKGLRVPRSRFLRSVVVPHGFDVADRWIAEQVQPGDLVVTADVPLAADVVGKGGFALNPRGELYTEDNVGEHLSVRNLMDELRSNGMVTGGPPAYGETEKRAFANQLDRLLAQRERA